MPDVPETDSDVRVLVVTSAHDELVRHVNTGSIENVCVAISCLAQELAKRDQRIVKIVVQSNHLRERLS